MTKITKNLKSYIETLPILGIPPIIAAIICIFIFLNVKNPDDWSKYNFYFKLLGALIGYIYMSRINPGGRVTLNFDKSTYNEDEKALYNLIIKYRSKLLMAFAPILYLVLDFIVGQSHKTSVVGSVEQYFAFFIMGLGLSLFMCFGIKYLSAWWNIKKNWKKEFGE